MEQILFQMLHNTFPETSLDTQEEGTNIRIFVVNPGTPGQNVAVLLSAIQLKRLRY